jgi:hypothetical protein
MKLIIILAALFVTITTANATQIVGFKCPDLNVDFDVNKDKVPYTTTLSITQSYDDPKSVLRFKIVRPKKGGTELYMNGKHCKTMLLTDPWPEHDKK